MNTDFQGHRYRAVVRHHEDEEQLLQVGPVVFRVTSRGTRFYMSQLGATVFGGRGL